MTALYEIANDYAELMNEDMDPEMIADTLEGIDGEFSDKIEQMLAIIKNETAYSLSLKNEEASLAARRKTADTKVNNIKQYISSCLETMDKKSYTAGIHKITVRKGAPKAEIKNADIIPVDFKEFVTETKIDKKLILERLKLGESIDGVDLITGKSSLVIK